MPKKSLTIVGAGVSGLYLAYLLQEHFEITIIEARDRIGGRIFCLEGHDMGPSWIWPHQTQLLGLLKEFDIDIFPQFTQGDALYESNGVLERFSAPSSPSFRARGTLCSLTQALYERLQGVAFCFEEAVRSVGVLDEGVSVATNKNIYKSDYVAITLPPRLASLLAFTPPLPPALHQQLLKTQTWMGNSAKCVVEFKTPFWRERGLSDFLFSHVGPLGEIHDACSDEKAALFGFVQLHANMDSLKEDVTNQMVRIFGIERNEIVAVYVVDWKCEIYSAALEDATPRSAHPSYGIDMSAL